MNLTVEELREEHLPHLHGLFEGASSTCFCRYWHFEGAKNDWLHRCADRPEENAAELDAAVRSGHPSARGLVARDRTTGPAVLGWMKLTARAHVPKLRTLPVYRSVDLGDEATTFSIGCFLVRPEARGRGVARALVEAAPGFVRRWGGRAIEAYPRRSSEPLHPEEVWQGPESVFVRAGFELVYDQPAYPVYRLVL